MVWMGSDYLKLWEPGRLATLEHMVLGVLRNTSDGTTNLQASARHLLPAASWEPNQAF